MKTFQQLLKELKACNEAIVWSQNMTIEETIKASQRGDWLLWLAKKIDLPIDKLTLTKGHCAKTVFHLMKDERSRKAVDAAIAFGEGKISKEELKNAAYAAYAAADAAADAATDAADAADAAAYAAAYAADAAAYAADAADAADAAADARTQTLQKCADIVRKHYPKPPALAARREAKK